MKTLQAIPVRIVVDTPRFTRRMIHRPGETFHALMERAFAEEGLPSLGNAVFASQDGKSVALDEAVICVRDETQVTFARDGENG